MRRMSLLFAVLFVVPLFGYDSPKEYDGAMEAAGIEGTWRLPEDGPVVPKVRTFRNGTYTIKWSDGDTFQGSYRIDSTRNPPHLDWIPSSGQFQGQTLKSLYQIDGDTLKITSLMGLKNMGRPQGFNDKGVLVYTYKRVK